MFKNLFKKNGSKEGKAFAIQSGEVINIEDVKDAMFAQRILGDGIAVVPSSGEIYSPVSGKVTLVANTEHAFGIETEDGLEVLVHIGLETVELKGEGFETKVKAGDTVKAGDLLTVVDLELLKEKNYDITTPVIITNMDEVKEITKHTGEATEKETVVFEYIKK